MLSERETPHHFFLPFDSWARNSPTSVFLQPLQGGSPIICLSALDLCPFFPPPTLNDKGGKPPPTMFLSPLDTCPQGGSTEGEWRAEGRGGKRQGFSPLSLLQRLHLSLQLQFPPAKQTYVALASIGGLTPLSILLTLELVAASCSGNLWGSLTFWLCFLILL